MVTKLEFVLTIAFLFGFLAFMNTVLPAQYKFATTLDLVVFIGQIIGIGAACVITTGIPCAAAIGVGAAFTVGTYFATDFNLLKIMIFTPLQIGMIWTIISLARGDGG
jgi:hypothetical protein